MKTVQIKKEISKKIPEIDSFQTNLMIKMTKLLLYTSKLKLLLIGKIRFECELSDVQSWHSPAIISCYIIILS